jgi:hypothetical protein
VQVLAAHRILSAPVVVASNGGEAEGDAAAAVGADKAPEVSGFIDIRDLLSSFLQGGWVSQGGRMGVHVWCMGGCAGGRAGSLHACPAVCLPLTCPPHPAATSAAAACACARMSPAEVDLKALADAKMLKRMRILEEQVGGCSGCSGWGAHTHSCTHAAGMHACMQCT